MTDTIARGTEWLQTLLRYSGVSAEVKGEFEEMSVASEDSPEVENFWLTIDEAKLTPEQINVLIGIDGLTLDAIQYLANSILNLNQPPEYQASYTIELSGYRVKRQQEIQAIALRSVEQVRSTGQEVEIKSLSSAERRQIHTLLKDYSDLETFSQGREPHRHLIVRPAIE